MNKEKQMWKREDLISIVITVLFVLGFLILSWGDIGYTGLSIDEFDRDFGTEAVFLGADNQANFPHNMTGEPNVTNVWHDKRYINFTYNVSSDQDYVDNCTLWMDIDDAGYEANESVVAVWYNESDGFKASGFSGNNPTPYALTTNGSDFWITDTTDDWIYHVKADGTNVTGACSGGLCSGFPDPALGDSYPVGITTNGSDFWIVSILESWVYHTNRSGGNISDGFSGSFAGASQSILDLTTNGSDFWIIDTNDDWIYHVKADGTNISGACVGVLCGGFSASFAGNTPDPRGITTNGSDFWIIDGTDLWVYHTNRSGGNISDGFSLAPFDIDQFFGRGITTPTFQIAQTGGAGGTPTDFWFTDFSDFVYHAHYGIEQTINQTINKSFEGGVHNVNWKVGCYDDAAAMTNTSARNLYINYLVTQSKPNIGAMAYYDPKYVVGMWSFERVEGSNVVDTTGKNNGTRINSVKWCPDEGGSGANNCTGRIGKGVDFDGKDDYINISNAENFNSSDEFTISAWFRADSNDTWRAVVWKGVAFVDGFTLEILTTAFTAGNMTFSTHSGNTEYSTISTIAIEPDKWYHVVGVYKNPGSELYINGKLDNTHATSQYTAGNKSLLIGRSLLAGVSNFNGTIDEVVFWNRTLSANEVKQLYYSSADSYNSTYTVQDIAATPNNTADADNDTIKYIYNWYKDNVSIAVLNMPFEAVSNGSEQNFSKDYSGLSNDANILNFNSHLLECKGTGSTTSCSGWNRTGGVDGFGAYEFDGKGDYINISDPINLNFSDTANFTISVWLKSKKWDTRNSIIWKGTYNTEGYIMFAMSGKVWFSVLDGTEWGTRFDEVLDLGKWYHIVSVYKEDSTGLRFYVNGKLEDNNSLANYGAGDKDFFIGHASHVAFNDFNGTLDEVMVFNRSLSDEQVLALYRNQTHIIKAAETNPYETWHAQVVANDGYGDSTPENTTALHLQTITLNVDNVAPANSTSVQVGSEISFTYNYTNYENISGVDNCSLYLYETQWKRNNTKYWPIEDISNSFNITLGQGTYKWKVGCYDIESEQTNSSAYNLTIVPPSEGGGSSPSLISTKTQMIEAGVSNFIEFNNPNIPLIGMNVILNKDASLSLEAKKISENQFENKLDDAYAYFSLKSNLDNSYFDYVAINFKIKKKYENVKLYQLGDSWQELDVVKIYEDSKYKYYQTSVNSLGYFGISAEEVKQEKVKTSLKSSDIVGKKEETVEQDVFALPIVLLILALLMVMFVYHRNKSYFSKRIKIFIIVFFIFVGLLSLINNIEMVGYSVKNVGLTSIIGIIIFLVLAIIFLICWILKSKKKTTSIDNKSVRFKLLAKQIMDKLEHGRVMDVGDDYKELINMYKNLIVGKTAFEQKKLYNIIEDVYEKYVNKVKGLMP